jgi:hypothetical protein
MIKATALAAALLCGFAPMQASAQFLRGNSVRVEQVGSGNAAAVAQNGADNRARLVQRGNGNSGRIVQNGDRNNACLYQRGNGLNGTIVQEGHDSLVALQTERGVRTGRGHVLQGRLAYQCR